MDSTNYYYGLRILITVGGNLAGYRRAKTTITRVLLGVLFLVPRAIPACWQPFAMGQSIKGVPSCFQRGNLHRKLGITDTNTGLATHLREFV